MEKNIINFIHAMITKNVHVLQWCYKHEVSKGELLFKRLIIMLSSDIRTSMTLRTISSSFLC